MRAARATCLAVVLHLHAAAAFYLPGVAPREYSAGDELKLMVNSLTSVQTHLPYEYYDLDFCRPEAITDQPENLGQLLLGSDIKNSPFQVRPLRSTLRASRAHDPLGRRSAWARSARARCCARRTWLPPLSVASWR